MHRSPYFGQSIEFRQHRQYTYGDDLRYVDWKVWAKQDRYYVKQFEEETNLRCTLLVNVSGSMRYGKGPMNKYEYGCSIAASLAYLLLRQQDAVGCVAFDDAVRMTVPLRTKRNHLDSICRQWISALPRNKTNLYQILRNVAENYPRRGLMVLVSDLLVGREGLFQGLRLLRSRGHDILVFHVLDDDELDFPFTGRLVLRAWKRLISFDAIPGVRDGYLSALDGYLEEVRQGCTRHQADYVQFAESAPGCRLGGLFEQPLGETEEIENKRSHAGAWERDE